MIELNPNNYFSLENRAITSSRIKDFMKCKNYFYRKHILGTVSPKKTSAMEVGSIVDEFLTQDEIKKKYIVGDKRLREFKNREDVIVISETQYNEIMGLAIAVEQTTAYKELKNYKRQQIIQIPWEIEPHFDSIAGMIDFYDVSDGGKITIVDLKTSATIDPHMYQRHAEGLQYYLQMAMYQILLQLKYKELMPGVELSFESRHLVVEKQKDIYNVATFIIDQERINFEKDKIRDILEEIKNEREFKKRDAKWETAQTI